MTKILSILRSIYFYFCFVISLVVQIPRILTAKSKSQRLQQRDFDKYVHGVAYRWARGNARRSGSRFHVTGLENIPRDEAVVFVSNHQGNFDIAVLLSCLPVPHGYIAKIEIMKIPLLRDWMINMRCVFIDRKSIRQTAGALLEGIKTLQDGHSMVLFPEGTRSKSDKLGEFKVASFKLATKAGVPIVPITINGTYKIMEANGGLLKPADVYVTVHPIIRMDAVEDLSTLPGLVRGVIESGLGEVAI